MEASNGVIESAQDVLARLGAIGTDAREELSHTDAVKLAWAKTCKDKSEQWSRRMQRSERPAEVLERLGRKRRSSWSAGLVQMGLGYVRASLKRRLDQACVATRTSR